MLYLASDHRGFKLKERIKQWLSERRVEFEDIGAFSYQAEDDYPDFARQLAERLLARPSELGSVSEDLGIAICGSGAGMTIALNRFKGVLAGLALLPAMAEAARREDNINVLVLPADFIEEETALKTVESFLATKFENAERRLRRLKKIEGDS